MISILDNVSYYGLNWFNGQLAYDYLCQKDGLGLFYPHAFYPDVNPSLDAVIPYRTKSLEQRRQCVSAIRDYNDKYNAHSQVNYNLDALLEKDTYVVMTGQQAGLLTGPLYTIYKALTAILLCREWNRYRKEYFVPVFWVASEDDDINEVNRLYCSHHQEIIPFQLSLGQVSGPVENLNLDDHSNVLLQHIKDILASLEYGQQSFNLIEDAIGSLQKKSNPMTFSTLFVRLMSEFFGPKGLILVEPYLIRNLAMPFYQQVFEHHEIIEQTILKQQQQVSYFGRKQALHINKDVFPLFLNHQVGKQTKRIRLKKHRLNVGTIWKDDSGLIELSNSQLKNYLSNYPERFSHNVMMVPLVQDAVFPKVVNVCGPGELNYYAELKQTYDYLLGCMPICYPRISVTLCSKKINRIKNKFNLNFQSILNGNVDSEVSVFLQQQNGYKQVHPWCEMMFGQLNGLKSSVKEKELLDVLNPSIRKIQLELTNMKKRSGRLFRTKSDLSLSQIDYLKTTLLPRQKMQERVMNIFYYLGINPSLINELECQHNILSLYHQVVSYE